MTPLKYQRAWLILAFLAFLIVAARLTLHGDRLRQLRDRIEVLERNSHTHPAP